MSAGGWRIAQVHHDKAALCRALLTGLPDWFGRADAIDAYARQAQDALMLGAFIDAEIAGCLTLVPSGRQGCEIAVMAVRRVDHRKGLGRALVCAAQTHASGAGRAWIDVRTVADTVPDSAYAATRAFYQACGFRQVSHLPDHWGAGTDAVLLRRSLGDCGSGAGR